MTNKFRLRARARADLLKIGRYTQRRWGRTQRNHYLKQLDEAFRLIAENPEIGTDRAHVKPGYRSYQQGSHVIFYRNREWIEIVRVLHKNMDVEKHIK